MPCQSCIERRAKMKAWIARRLGQGKFIDANPPANVREGKQLSNIKAVRSPPPQQPPPPPRASSDANPPANVQAPRTRRAAAPVESSTDAGRPAIDTGTEYRKQRLETIKASNPGAGRVSMPKVRKTGSRKGIPRRPQG